MDVQKALLSIIVPEKDIHYSFSACTTYTVLMVFSYLKNIDQGLNQDFSLSRWKHLVQDVD